MRRNRVQNRRSVKRGPPGLGVSSKSIGRAMGSSPSDSVIMPFRLEKLFTFTASTTLQSLNIDYNLSTRLAGLATYYVFYRFVSLKMVIFPFTDSTTTSNQYVFAYSPNSENGAAVGLSFSDCSQLTCRAIHSVVKTTNTFLRVPVRILLSDSQRMFPCGTSSVDSSVQGILNVIPRASGTSAIVVGFSGKIQFIASAPISGEDMTVRAVSRFKTELDEDDEDRDLNYSLHEKDSSGNDSRSTDRTTLRSGRSYVKLKGASK